MQTIYVHFLGSVDASNKGLGNIISQKVDNELWTIKFGGSFK